MMGEDTVALVRRAAWVGLSVNALLSAVKGLAGLIGGSQAVVADALHSLSDLGTDLALLIGVRYWSAPPDDCHPHGHGRIETMVSACIGLSLALAAVGIGYMALADLQGDRATTPRWGAFVAALVSIVVKEWLYRWTRRLGTRIGSTAVIANAWHHRSDAFSSLPVAGAVAASLVSPAWAFLDRVCAVVVAVMVLRIAGRILWSSLGELIDAAAPSEVRERIAALAAGTAGVRSVHRVRTRYVGARLHVDLHALVDPQMTVREGHDVSEHVKERLLLCGPDVIDVVVHLEPHEDGASGASRGAAGR